MFYFDITCFCFRMPWFWTKLQLTEVSTCIYIEVELFCCRLSSVEKRYFILQPSSQSAVFVNKPNLFFPFVGFGRCLVYRKQTCLLKRYANQVILYSHLMSTKPINTARLFSVSVFVSLLSTNHENTKRVTKLLRSLGDIKWLLLPLKLLKKLARRINSLSSALIVIKGLNLATQQVIVAWNTIVVTHLVLFSFFISLLNTWM